jgi:hypothetical protein
MVGRSVIGRTSFALLCVLGTGATQAQDATSRRIDSNPRLIFGPPPVTTSAPSGPEARPSPRPLDRPPDTEKRERDRRVALELEGQARRDALVEEGGTAQHYIAAIAFVIGSGLVILAVLTWASARRAR